MKSSLNFYSQVCTYVVDNVLKMDYLMEHNHNNLFMLSRSTFNIVALFSERAHITQPRIPPHSCLDQPLTTQPAQTALRGKSGLSYMHSF